MRERGGVEVERVGEGYGCDCCVALVGRVDGEGDAAGGCAEGVGGRGPGGVGVEVDGGADGGVCMVLVTLRPRTWAGGEVVTASWGRGETHDRQR